MVSSVAVRLFWGGWLRSFPNVAWLEYPLNYGFPAALMIGSGVVSFPLARRLRSRIQALGLMDVGAALVGIGLFLVPQVNQAVIGLF